MPDAVWVVIVFVGIPLILVIGIRALVKRSRGRFSAEGAVAETFVREADGAFEITVPPSSKQVGIYVDYSVTGAHRKNRGLHYGLVLRVDVERTGFEQRGEYLVGDAVRPFGEAPQRQSLDASMIVRMGTEVRRTLLVARVPAGEAVRVSGKVKRTAGDGHSVQVFAKLVGG